MVNSCAVCGCCTRTDIVREHLEDTLRICDVSAKGLYINISYAEHWQVRKLCHLRICSLIKQNIYTPTKIGLSC